MFSLRNMIFMALMIHNVPLKYYKRVSGRQKQMNFLFIKNLSFFLIRQTITKENSFIKLYFISLNENTPRWFIKITFFVCLSCKFWCNLIYFQNSMNQKLTSFFNHFFSKAASDPHQNIIQSINSLSLW